MPKEIKIEPELLWSLYWGLDYSFSKIAELLNVSKATIGDKMHKYNIPRRLPATCHPDEVIIEIEFLKSLYYGNEYKIKKIAEIFKCSISVIHHRLNKYGIERRENAHEWSDDQRLFLSQKWKGRKVWNDGLTKETDERIMSTSKKLTGIKRTDETKRKVSIASKGRKYSEEVIKKRAEKIKRPRDDKWYNKTCDTCGKKIHRKESSIHKHNFCSNKCQNKWQETYFSGEGGSAWIDGRSFEPYPTEFNDKLRKEIRRRDNWTCQECGMTQKELGYTLSIHHIDYDKKNCDKSNLISLCHTCHMKTNWNRNQWIKYYQEKITF